MNTIGCHIYQLATQGAPNFFGLQKNSGPKIIISECHESPIRSGAVSIHLQHRVLLSANPPISNTTRFTYKAFKYRPSAPYHRAVQYIKQDGWMDGWMDEWCGDRKLFFGCGQLCSIHPHASTYLLATKCLTYLHSNPLTFPTYLSL